MNERDIFIAAIRIENEASRKDYLDEACGPDPALRERVEALLRANERPNSVLDAQPIVPTVDSHRISEAPGTSIGPYKLLQVIGEGGFGVVYMAEQKDPVRRKVALKIIKPGMDTREVVARFEAERQALALMDHPNIARVLDAGSTESGRPYFVMDLVKGVPITEFCDRNRLGTRERLEMFASVCRAVQHAHQKGVVHRDLKPSNVMVTLHDGKPVCKVIDFGVAKAISQQLTEKTLFTAYGQIVGTPQYMSPEQAEMSGLDVDTRSDIYSLGVLLYELLTGGTPLDASRLRSSGYGEMLRIIQEEDPPRPSTKVSTLGDEATVIAQHRRTDAKRLSRDLRGELDWIVMKALEKDRERRYDTANNFAADIERFLNDEAVDACPPSAGYRIRKFALRHRGPVTAVSAVLLTLCIGLAGTIVGLLQANREAERAQSAKREAEEAASEASELAARNFSLAQNESQARNKAETRTREANAIRLAAQSQYQRGLSPLLSLQLGIEAVNATYRLGEEVVPIAHQALLNSAAIVGGRPVPDLKSGAMQLSAFSRSGRRGFKVGRWLLTVGHNNSVRRWDLTADEPSPLMVLPAQEREIRQVEMSPDGRWLAATDTVFRAPLGRPKGSPMALLFDLTRNAPSPAPFELPHEGVVYRLSMTSDSRWLVTVEDDRLARLWNLRTQDPTSGPITLQRHVSSTLIAPDGRWLVGWSYRPNQLSVWDLRSEDPASESFVLSLEDRISSVAISPDSHWLVTVSAGTAKLWNLNASDPNMTSVELRCDNATISRVEFGPNGRWLVAGCSDANVRCWDLAQHDFAQPSLVLRGHNQPITFISMSPDGRWLATRASDRTVRMWDLEAEDPAESQLVFQHDRGVYSGVYSAHISPDSRWLVTTEATVGTGQIKRAFVWDLTAADPTGRAEILVGPVRPIGIGPNSRWLVTDSYNPRTEEAQMRLWDLSAEHIISSPLLLRGKRASNRPIEIATTPDGRWLIATHPDNTVRMWGLRVQHPGTRSRILRGHEDSVESLALSTDGRWLVSGAADGTARVWDIESDNPDGSQRVLDGHEGPIKAVAVSPEGTWVVTNSDGVVRLWQIGPQGDDLVPQEIPGPHDPDPVAITDRWVVTAGEDGTIRLWDLFKIGEAAPLDLGRQVGRGPIRSLATTPDGRWMVASRDDNACVWDLRAPDVAASCTVLRGHTSLVVGVAITPDGRWVATGSDDRTARLWDLQATDPSEQSVELAGIHSDYVWSVAISNDGRWLAAGSADSTVRLWDLHLPTPSSRILRQRGSVRRVVLTGDGRWLAAHSGNGTIRLWGLDVNSLLERAQHLAGRELTAEERREYLLQ